MYLASVTMQGFKSFPDRTQIDFLPGITAIVGPNGSGKSNVMEAVRWVLGEQSAKSLRGDKMEDVIFNGTQTRRRMGFAEVSIEFNQAQSVTGGQDKLIVTRRYYRDGDSEYLINNQPVRLKDINELFADTGVGKRGYSIISQGKVDELLSEQGNERRRIFDEAAGIVKFKLRRKEALRRLQEGEKNLTRSEDAITLLSERQKPLAKAAATLKKFRQLESRARFLDLALSVSEEQKRQEQSLTIRENLSSLSHSRSSLESDLTESATKDLQLKQLRTQLETESETLRKEQIERQAEQANLREEQARTTAQRQFYQKEIDRLRQESENSKLDHQALLAKIDLLAKQLSQSEPEKIEPDSALIEAEAKYQELSETEAKLSLSLEQLDQEISQLESTILAEREQELQLSAKIQSLQQEIDSSKARELERQDQLAVLGSQAEELKARLAGLAAESDSAKTNLQLAEQDISQLEIKLKSCKDRVVSHRLNSEEAKLKADILQAAENQLDGYRQSYRSLVKAGEQDPDLIKGLVGPFGRLLQVESTYEKAIERALGPALHYLVCLTKHDAQDLIAWLKRKRAGRETFLPLDHFQGRKPRNLSAQLRAKPGCLGLCSEFVDTDTQYQALVDDFLGSILLVDSLETGLDLQGSGERNQRMVSLSGELLYPSGSVTGGEESKRSKEILARQRELKAALITVEQELELSAQAAEELTKLQQDQAKFQAEYNLAKHKSQEIERQTFVCQTQLDQVENQVKQLTKIDQAGRLEDPSDLIQSLAIKQENLSSLRLTRENKIRQKDQVKLDLLQLKSDLNQVWQLIQSKKYEYEQRLNQAKLLADQLAELKSTAAETESQTLQKQAEIKLLISRNDSLLKEEVERTELLAKIKQQADNEDLEFAELENRRKELFANLDAQQLEAERLRDQLNSLNLQIARRENDLARFEQKLVEEKNRLWEQYELSWQEVLDQAGELDLSPAKARQELSSLRQELRQLGPIQADADVEYSELEERLDFLRTQHDDLRKAQREVETLITKLDQEMKDQFNREFEQLRQAFQEVFKELFQGGRADLILLDPDDLNSQIEIKAQPPGKKLQTLSLLSGGERALTAIAILFALFKLRPAPFAFLDEVESALDESNIDRFTAYLQGYTSQTQFILVTHRKNTMAAAERIYGISMKEKGVSELLSLKLESVQAEEV